MKRSLASFVLFSLICITTLHAQNTPAGSQDTLSVLLARFPAGTTEELRVAMRTMENLDEKELEQLVGLLKPPGKGDNTALEYALNAFSTYATQPGKAFLKARAARSYSQSLDHLTDKENKAFMIRQLQIVGDDKAAVSLKKYLLDERLCDPAARALVKINTPVSENILATGLKQARGANIITLVEALGDTRYREAAPSIAPYAAAADQKLRKAALYALSSMADPASETVLARAAAKADYAYEETGATAAYLRFGTQLAANGMAEQALRIAESLLKNTTTATQPGAHTGAVKLITIIRRDKSIPLLISAMSDNNLQFREAVLQFAAKFTSNTDVQQWTASLPKFPPDIKIAVIDMLGIAGNPSVVPAIIIEMNSKDRSVQLAAIRVAAALGGEKVLADLFNTLEKGDAEIATAITNAMLIMKGPDVVSKAADNLTRTSSPTAKAAMISFLAARSSAAHMHEIFNLVKNNDTTISHAAFRALRSMTGGDDLPALYMLLPESKDTIAIQSLQVAIVAATLQMQDTNRRAHGVLYQMQRVKPDEHELFYPILAGVGGPDALAAMNKEFTIGNAQSKHAAIAALSSWTDESSALFLLQLSRQAGNSEYSSDALDGYLEMAARPQLTDDQKILMLHNAMALTRTIAQKQHILKMLSASRTFPALIYAGEFLDSSELRSQAAQAVVKIALSSRTTYGKIEKDLLERSLKLLQDGDDSTEKKAAGKRMNDPGMEEGFVSLFNKQDLSGWKGLVENPIAREKMSPDSLAAKQATADERMRKGWFVKNGELIFSGHGDNLCTTKKYGDFEMYVDWKITKEGDAGIYLRGSPQVQIWDTSRRDAGAEVGSGGLYNNAVYQSKPLKLADNAIGEWNTFHIIMKGERVTVYLNGELVVDNTILENYWDRNRPIFSQEQIELQAHGSYVAYRNIYIREMPSVTPYAVSEAEEKDGFKSIFDGVSLQGWTGNTTDYTPEDGNVVIYPQHGGHGNLYTKQEYANFVYRFEFQLTPGANNGIGIRAPLEGDAAYVGMEIQVLDNEADMYRSLHPYQYHGSVYGVIPAKRGYLKAVGEWNEEEITADRNHIKVVLNGTIILDGDIGLASANGTMDGKAHPGLKRPAGHIGFLGHGDIVKFRNLRVKILP